MIMKRRSVLALIGAGLMTGCLQDRNQPGDTPTNSPAPPPTPTPTPELTTAFEVASRSCGSGDEDATVQVTPGAVDVTGVIGGRNTCDTAALDTVRFDDGQLTISVIVVAEDEDAACAQCITDIEYTATVGVGTREIEEVIVEHDGTVVVRASA